MNKEKYNSNVTKEDLNALKERTENLRSDNSDDAYLKDRKHNVDFAGKDLDIPGRNLPHNKTTKSYKDEENQLYSLGSDDNENLEIDTKN